MRQENTTPAPFNAPAIKKLLLDIRVSDETGELLGVPPAQLEEWLRQLAVHLEDACAAHLEDACAALLPQEVDSSRPCGLLSPVEIHFLLDGYGSSLAEYA